jgi:hypothetical protein
MTLLRALAMPFQPTSLMFVGLTSPLLAIAAQSSGPAIVPAIVAAFFLLSWLNKFAFALMEQAANGIVEAPVASVEMLGPFGGARPLVHVVVGGSVAALSWWIGGYWGQRLWLLALLALPASVGALTIDQRLLAAVSPLALWRTVRGLSHYYLLLVLAMVVIGSVAWSTARSPLWNVLRFALLELLLLILYTLIGGAIYLRRAALGFEPRISPERQAARNEHDRLEQRQRLLDAMYSTVQVRDYQRATDSLRHWLIAADSKHLAADVQTFLAQVALWPQRRGLLTVAQTLVSHLISIRQLSLAMATAATALQQLPDFAPGSETETITLARYAQFAGRPKLAINLLDNRARATQDVPLSEVAQQLRRELAS